MRLFIGSPKELDNLGPEGPGNIIDPIRFWEQGNDNVLGLFMLNHVGLNGPLFKPFIKGLLGQNLVKLRRVRAFPFKKSQMSGIHVPQDPVLFMTLGPSLNTCRNSI
jgi:hypothetical protein